MDQQDNVNIQPSAPASSSSIWKNTKLTIISMFILGVIAIGGIVFGIYGMTRTDTHIPQSDDVGDAVTIKTEVSENNEKERNPVIFAESPVFYRLHYTSAIISLGTDGEFSLNISIQDGMVDSCNVNSIESKWVDDDDGGGMIRNTRFLKECNIEGITGKIYKVVEVGEGHDGSYDSVAFIMEDGSVEYLPLLNALKNEDFSIAGKLRIDGFVTDAFTISVGEEGKMSGYGSTVFVLSDGSYIKYDNSMLQ